MTQPDVHPLCLPLAPLFGSWQGTGHGEFPTIDSFGYVEDLMFSSVPGKPVVVMAQRTQLLADGSPSHAETGYLRPQTDGTIELVVAQPSGVLESLVGSATPTDDGVAIDLESVGILLSPTAKSVTATHRRITVVGDGLDSDLSMAAVGLDMTHHLHAELRRT